MKTNYTKLNILVLLMFFFHLGNSQQRVVPIRGIIPGEPLVYDQIFKAITDDAANRVANKNVVYELKRGQVYLATSTINSTDYDLYIRAEAGTGPLPIIFHTLNSAGSSAALITARKNLILENLEFDGKHSDGSLGNRVLNGYGANSRVILRGCRLINDRGGAFAIQVDGVKIYMIDCIIGNQGHHISIGGNGRALDIRNTNTVDTVVIQNCTIYNLSDRIVRNMAPVINYFKFDHNTVTNVQGYHGSLQLGKTKKAVITNNIFANALTYGNRYPARWRAEQTQPDKDFAVVTHDSLSAKLTSATIEMRNNNIYHDKMFVDFFNQTPPGDSIGDVRPVNNAIVKFVGTGISQAYFNEPLVLKNTSSAQMLYEFLIHWVNYPKDAVFPNNFSVIYPYEWDVSYPATSKSYTAGDNGLPVGNLNAFPDKKALWTKSAQIGSKSITGNSGEITNLNVWPNPFISNTTIYYSIPEKQKIEVSVLNSMGQKIITLQDSKVSEGDHNITWDGKNDNGQVVSKGLYLISVNGIKMKSIVKILKN